MSMLPPDGSSWIAPPGYTLVNLGECRSCGAAIAWCLTLAGKRAPLNPDGTSHFANCPAAQKWRKPR